MPRAQFKAFKTDDTSLNRVQSNITDALQPYIGNPLIDGRLIQGQAIVAGANVINHGLGRKLIGWIQTRVRSVVSYSIGTSNPINLVPATGSPASLSGTFTSVAGGLLIIRCGISAFTSVGNATLTVTVSLDGANIATSNVYATAANSTFTAVPFSVFVTGAAKGTHTVTYTLSAGNWDGNIYSHCAVDEVGPAYPLYDTQDSNTTPEKTLNLFSSSACTADFWVY